MRRATKHGTGVVGLVLGATLAAGCSDMPTDGPIVETRSTPEVSEPQPMEINPLPPTSGASRVKVVTGFLDAMTAWPRRPEVAGEYLSDDAEASWNPEATITYDDVGPLREDGADVVARVSEPQLIDRRGSWRGAQQEYRRHGVEFGLVREDGEFRIDDPPDAMLVPQDWFADRYRHADLYFLDRSSRVLVPEPVFVPRGEQLATTLVARLLEGPADSRVETTAFDSKLTVDFSVPVENGVAQIALEGAGLPGSQQQLEQMVAQLAWTLQQERIEAFRLTISGEQVVLEGGISEFDVDSTPEYNPAGHDASRAFFGLRGGRLVSGDENGLNRVKGPFGRRPAGVRSVGVSLDGDTAAAVSSDGGSVLVGPVEAEVDGESRIRRVLTGAQNLLEPGWDFAGRAWLMDRGDGSARVWYVADGRARELQVPGVTGRRVRAFLISRDGTRLVTVVRDGRDDILQVCRIQVQGNSAKLRALPSHQVQLEPTEESGERIKDIAWTSPTTIAALKTVLSGERYDVERVAVDGAPVDIPSTSLSADVLRLIGSPVGGTRQYAATRTSLYELNSLQQQASPGEVTSLDYVG